MQPADARELDADLTLLLSRGYLETEYGRFCAPSHPRAIEALQGLGVGPSWPADLSRVWLQAFRGGAVSPGERKALLEVGASPPRRSDAAQDTWIATRDEVDLGFRLLPIVLALRAAGLHSKLAAGERLDAAALAADTEVGASALAVLEAAGVVAAAGEPGARAFTATAPGKRVGEKGAGPMGIIEAYHPYMAKLDEESSSDGRNAAWVTRGANIAASQDANRGELPRRPTTPSMRSARTPASRTGCSSSTRSAAARPRANASNAPATPSGTSAPISRMLPSTRASTSRRRASCRAPWSSCGKPTSAIPRTSSPPSGRRASNPKAR